MKAPDPRRATSAPSTSAPARCKWSFHTIPHPGEEGYTTWSENSWQVNGGANNWAGMALDEARGLVFVPTGSAAPDFHGADRVGDNLFANCLLALDAATGKKVWHFQAVHHDIWDRDFPSPPTLVTMRRDGRAIDAVAQTTKHGYVFVLDRETGAPLFPVDETAVAASAVPGERASRTQPVPRLPEPFARQTADRRPADAAHARGARLGRGRARQDAHRRAVHAASRSARTRWCSLASTAARSGAAAPTTRLRGGCSSTPTTWPGPARWRPTTAAPTAASVYLKSCANCHRDDRRGTPPQIPALTNLTASAEQLTTVIRQGVGPHARASRTSRRRPCAPWSPTCATRPATARRRRQRRHGAPATPTGRLRFTGYKKFLDPDGYPAVAPPWGTLSAIDLNTGRLRVEDSAGRVSGAGGARA